MNKNIPISFENLKIGDYIIGDIVIERKTSKDFIASIFNKEYLKVEFRGSFCYSCGFYNYFDDLKIILKEKGLKTKITNVKEMDDGAIVTFKVI